MTGYTTQAEQFGTRPAISPAAHDSDDEMSDCSPLYRRYLELHNGRVYTYEVHRDNDHGRAVEADGVVAYRIELDTTMLADDIDALLVAWADRLERGEESDLEALYGEAGFGSEEAAERFSTDREIDWHAVERALHEHFDAKLPDGWALGGDEGFTFVAPDGEEFGQTDLSYWTRGGHASHEDAWIAYLEQVLSTDVSQYQRLLGSDS